jgi:hypothetical protein
MKRIAAVLLFTVFALAFAGTPVSAQETKAEGSLFAGYYNGQKGDWNYGGFNAALFLLDKQYREGRLRVGPSLGFVGWKGFENDVDFDGHKIVAGGEAQYLRASSKTSATLRYGVKEGGASVADAKLDVQENNTLLNAEVYYQQWWNRPIFGRMLVGFRADIDLDGGKTTKIGGREVSGDPRLNQSEYGPWAQLDLIQGQFGYLFAGLSATYRAFDQNTAVEPTLGIRLLREVVELKAGYITGTDNPAWGVGLIINLHHLPRYF